MRRRFNPNPNNVTKGVAEAGVTVLEGIDAYGRAKARRGEWTFAFVFFIIGGGVAMWIGERGEGLIIGIVFSIIGACLATYLNWRQRKRIRLGLAKPYRPPAPSAPKPYRRYGFGGPFAAIGYTVPFLFDSHNVSGALFFTLVGLVVGYCLSLYMNSRDRKINAAKRLAQKQKNRTVSQS